MEPSNFTIQAMPRNLTQNSASQGLWNGFGTLNSTPNQLLIPVPKHVQGTQFPLSFIPMETLPQQTRVVGLETIDFGEREQVKQKRYRKRNFKKTTSVYRGVTRCKGRFESFVWDKDLKTTGKRGKTVYIGGFKNELEAARAHDLIVIKLWGKFAYTNFPATFYWKEIPKMKKMSLREYILELRRVSKDASMAATDGSNISSTFAGASLAVEGNNVVGDALSNPESTTMQPVFQEIGQQYQTPTTLQNLHDNVEGSQSMYDDQFPWSDLDLSFPVWPFAFGTQVEHHANALGSALNGESSMYQMANENPAGAGNGSVASFGASSMVGFHSMEPNIQPFEAQNLHVASAHRYEPLQYGFATNTDSPDENMVFDNDLDITQYLNLDFSDMDD